MPIYNKVEIGRAAQHYGYVRDTFEKVLRLKEILRFLNEEEYLREHLLLKGGTAINLTVFNLPRLSVDIDMDYTPNDTKEDMLEARDKIITLIKDYLEAEGYKLSKKDNFMLDERKQQAKDYIAELMQLTEREQEYICLK